MNVRINYIDAHPEKAEMHMRAIQLTVNHILALENNLRIKQTTMDG